MNYSSRVYLSVALTLSACGVLFQNCAAAPPPDLGQLSNSSVYVPSSGSSGTIGSTSSASSADSTYVTSLYQMALGRAPTATELNNTLTELNNGSPKNYVQEELMYSNKFENLSLSDTVAVARMFAVLLGRSPTSNESSSYANLLASYKANPAITRPRTKIEYENIVGSSEYNNLYPTSSRAMPPTYQTSATPTPTPAPTATPKPSPTPTPTPTATPIFGGGGGTDCINRFSTLKLSTNIQTACP